MNATPGTLLITGSTGALGTSVARHLSTRGSRVVLVDRVGATEALSKLAAELGANAVAAPFDVTSRDGWAAAFSTSTGASHVDLGAIDGAVLIAGGWSGGAPLHAGDDGTTWRPMLEANLETAHGSLAALLPGMVARRRGSIVVVGSRAVERPWTSAGASAYAASKSAVVALMQSVAAEVIDHGVRLNAVLPSTIDTPANRAAMPDADTSRWVSTDSLAEVIAFLLSDASRDVSGAAIPVYGRG